jgi:hypothetical protein
MDLAAFKYAFTFFGGLPFTTHNYGQITCGCNCCGVIAPSQSAQFTLGAALERQIQGPVSLQLSFAGSHVDPPYGYFNINPNPYGQPTPVPKSVPNGATLYSADIDAIWTLHQIHGSRFTPYFVAGLGLNRIHIPGGDTVMEGNAEMGFVIGGGLKVQLPQRWELRPELHFLLPTGDAYGGQPFVGTNRITIGISRSF